MSYIKNCCFFILSLILLSSNVSGGQIIIFSGGGDAKETSADQRPGEIEMDFFGEGALRATKIASSNQDHVENSEKNTFSDQSKAIDRKDQGRKKFDWEKDLEEYESLPSWMKKGLEKIIDWLQQQQRPDAAEKKSEESEESKEYQESKNKSKKKTKKNKVRNRPALRHHIAHFCPTLEDARTCIRTCMKVGKPAFCGKDQRCYCGHKYDDHSQDPEVDIHDMYAQFRDLYTKYFGPDVGETGYGK